MIFNSVEFLAFFVIVTSVYFLLPKKVRYIWLLAASYFFYMNWNKKYALLIFFSTAVTYLSGILIEKFSEIKKKKIVVAGSFILNIGLLVFFKYFVFLMENMNQLLRVAGVKPVNYVWNFALPVGISFYIFQALSYTVDVYRGEIRAEKNFLKYALFVSFFPQLVAGPIERSGNLLNQIRDIPKNSRLDYRRITNGLILMLWGLFVKMVIADRVAILVNHVFDYYYLYGTVELILGAVGFALQIYCDFAGYSIIAIGSAEVLGFTLMENFDVPYFAVSIKDFWRRWHISLSTWFRDYLYIPLGGNRGSKGRKWVNQMITMTISGVWHGANWTYIIWGAIHGIYQIVGDATWKWKERLNAKYQVKTGSFSYKFGKILITFILVDFAWIFFRADSIGQALAYIQRICSKWNPYVLFDGSLCQLGLDQREIHILLAAVIVLLLVDLLQYWKRCRIDCFLEQQCLWFRWMVIIGLYLAVVVFGIYGPAFDGSQFIYFQF